MGFYPLHQIEAVLLNEEENDSIATVLTCELVGGIEGPHYSSGAFRQKLLVLLNNGLQEVRYVFIKTIPTAKFTKNYVLGNGVIGKELKMYKNVLEPLERFMRNSNDFSEIMWARLIGNDSYNTIILEDLISLGYKKVNPQIGLDLDHSTIAFRTLAKFHALSVVLENAGLLDLYQLDKIHYISKIGVRNQRLQSKFLSIAQVIKEKLEPKYHQFATDIENSVESIMDREIKLMQRDQNAFNVLNHGDSWTSNLLFKYHPFSGKLMGMRFVDFQVSHYNSYAFDIQYILHTSVQYDVRINNYNQLLQAYHETLTATLAKYNVKPDNLPSLTDVHKEVESKLFFGLINSMHLLELMQADSTEPLTMEVVLGKPGVAPTKSMQTEHYLNKLKNLIDPYIDRKLFSE